MSFSFIISFILGMFLVIWGIVADGSLLKINFGLIMNFVDVASILITIGGTIAATFMSVPLAAFKQIPAHFKLIFKKQKTKPTEYIDILVDFAQEARRKGILSLEDKAAEQKDEFLSKSIMLIVDAIEPAKVVQMLETELAGYETRHNDGSALYIRAATFAPAFGMIGTLIGLINMLKTLDMEAADGATTMTQGMATALITTFYGSMLANIVLMPIANRLKAIHNEEMLCKEIIAEGVISIQAGDNPNHLREKLYTFLRTNNRNSSSDGGGSKKPKREKKSKGDAK